MGNPNLIRIFTICGTLTLLLGGAACSDSTAPVPPVLLTPAAQIPREVPFVQVVQGPDPGQAAVSWKIISWTRYTIEEYVVAMSNEGPVTAENWSRATVAGRYPWSRGQVDFREIFGAADGLIQGTRIWFAVRARDTAGNLSVLTHSPRLTLTREWWIQGQLHDVSGSPVTQAEMGTIPTGRTTLTDETGSFRIGPFHDIDRITLTIGGADPSGPWFGVTSKPMRTFPGQAEVTCEDLVLIPRWSVDHHCAGQDPSFLTYLRDMTLTDLSGRFPPSSILYRWENYPLKVYIPVHETSEGISMNQAATLAMGIWNSAMGEEYFVAAADSVSADIIFLFEDRADSYGHVSLLEPTGPNLELGNVIPLKMGISIDTKLPSGQTVAEVSLHEFGHTLGLINYSSCSGAGYLMMFAGGFGALNLSEPVHLDERRAVECIRYLPQGQDMALYR